MMTCAFSFLNLGNAYAVEQLQTLLRNILPQCFHNVFKLRIENDIKERHVKSL